MTDAEQLAFFRRVLSITGKHEHTDDLLWNKNCEFFVVCSDFFFWGTADCEPLTPDNVGEFERAILDSVSTGTIAGLCYGPLLFCARMRKMRPQSPCYKNFEGDEKLVALFNACGPERDRKSEG